MRLTPLLMAAILAGCTASPPPAPEPAPLTSYSGDFALYQAGRSEPVADPVYPQHGNPGIDVLHYGLDLSWAPAQKRLTGRATLHLRGMATAPEIRLDFSPAFTVENVLLNGVVASSGLADGKLTVHGGLAKDQQATLIVAYHGTPQVADAPTHRTDFNKVGLRVTDDGSLWTMQEPFGAFTWYPVNDHPSDKALYDIAITVPDGWKGIAGGTPAGQEGHTFRYTTTDPMASYLTTLAVGKYEKQTATGPHGLPLTYWYRPGRDEDMLATASNSPRYLQWIEERFGPYPFASAGVLIVPATSAMETQQLVTIGSMRSAAGADDKYREGVLVHEFLHHWFGDAVTARNWDSLWLNEGWAMFGQYLFQNERDSISMEAWENSARDTDAKLREQFGPPGKPDPADFGRSNMYVCPALMLNEIRKQAGDAAFYAMARDWVATNRNTVQDRRSFTAFVNTHTGLDLTALIDTWLDSPTTPPRT